MRSQVPTFADWYVDSETGGTKYWDGSSFTGDTRPPRKPFAAKARHSARGYLCLLGGVGFPVLGVLAFWLPQFSLWSIFEDRPDGIFGELRRTLERQQGVDFSEALATFAVALVVGVVLAAIGVYLLRGQGPTTKAVKKRLSEQRLAAQQQAAQFMAAQRQAEAQLARDAELREQAWQAMTPDDQAWHAYQRGDVVFETTMRVEDPSYRRTVAEIVACGWQFKEQVNHPEVRRKASTRNLDGGHDVIRTVTQDATFYFVRSNLR